MQQEFSDERGSLANKFLRNKANPALDLSYMTFQDLLPICSSICSLSLLSRSANSCKRLSRARSSTTFAYSVCSVCKLELSVRDRVVDVGDDDLAGGDA